MELDLNASNTREAVVASHISREDGTKPIKAPASRTITKSELNYIQMMH